MDLLGAVGYYGSDSAALTDPCGGMFHVGTISRICFLVRRKKKKRISKLKVDRGNCNWLV